MNSKQKSTIPVVLITGFGAFRSVRVNPSWEVAKALKTYLDWTHPIHLILQQIEVTYNDVTSKIPDFWIKYNPTLVIHLGVAAGSEEVKLERYACNTDYCHRDNHGLVPETGQCIPNDAPSTLSSTLPLDEICARVQPQTTVPVIVSEDAGRYLCEYIYYQSLFIDAKRTIFIHIPDVDQKFTIENLAETIQLIIYQALRYVVDPLPRLNRNQNHTTNNNNRSSSRQTKLIMYL